MERLTAQELLYADTDSIITKELAQKQLEQSITRHIMNSNYGLCVNVNDLSPAQRKEFMKLYLNSQYGTLVTNYKENKDMKIKDFIVLHADGQPVMIKKEAITALSKMSDGTSRVEIGEHIWITDDKYEDVIKRLFEV